MEWISVEDRLPERGQVVLGYVDCPAENLQFGVYLYENEAFCSYDINLDDYNIEVTTHIHHDFQVDFIPPEGSCLCTHWCELPNPPKQ